MIDKHLIKFEYDDSLTTKRKTAETNLFEAAKNYTKIVHEKLLCKPLQRKNMERKYEHSLEQLGAASLEYAIAIGSWPYDSTKIK